MQMDFSMVFDISSLPDHFLFTGQADGNLI